MLISTVNKNPHIDPGSWTSWSRAEAQELLHQVLGHLAQAWHCMAPAQDGDAQDGDMVTWWQNFSDGNSLSLGVNFEIHWWPLLPLRQLWLGWWDTQRPVDPSPKHRGSCVNGKKWCNMKTKLGIFSMQLATSMQLYSFSYLQLGMIFWHPNASSQCWHLCC